MKLGNITKSTMLVLGICVAPGAMAVSAEPAGVYSAGKVSLRFDGHGVLEVRQGEEVVVKGHYAIAGDEITLTDESGPWACKAEQARGIYRWTLANDALTFAIISDACEGRSGDLLRTWTHSK